MPDTPPTDEERIAFKRAELERVADLQERAIQRGSPTMPDTPVAWDRSLCPACHHTDHDPGSCPNCPRCELHTDEAFDWVLRIEPELVRAHIDALTAAVEALPEPTLGKKGGVERAAVLAILRGEQ